jgi:hypothetical protein
MPALRTRLPLLPAAGRRPKASKEGNRESRWRECRHCGLWGFMVVDHVRHWFVRGRAPGVDGRVTTSDVEASRSRTLLDLLRRVCVVGVR